MPRIFFKNSDKHLLVQVNQNLMQALRDAHIPVASSCGGDGVCAKCGIEILEGANNLSPILPLEKKLLERITQPTTHPIRIACQVQVRGDIKISTSYW